MDVQSRFDRTVCFSFDLDWAPDFMLADFRQLLIETRIPATIFYTHESPECRKLQSLASCEVGIHPNFFKPEPPDEVLDALLAAFPAARGVRNHVLYYHSRLLPLFHRRQIRYLSNELRFLEAGLVPHYDWSGLARLPLFWEDDVHMIYFDRDVSLQRLELQRPGLKVFNFHPVHLYLNSREMAYYTEHKEAIRDPRRGPELRQRSEPGVRTLFSELVAWAREQGALATLGEVADDFRRHAAYGGNFSRYLEEADRLEARLTRGAGKGDDGANG
ncbi:MAG: hypothetical protein KC609_19690 [Myxococcales bacterium]|nr:hypothetical protein [Myxococcales bacterium]